ncbi:MAG: flavin monoamine oxidase family protein [Candidatus Binatia bacterium]
MIGAGIAGLTAARDLVIDGYDVAILEARDRIGGRIWTSHELGVPADLGASWIHGFEDNPIARLARRHDIKILRTDISSVTPARYRSVALHDEDGRRLNDAETVEMSELMADYLDFIAIKQQEGVEMSLLAVEEAFAASAGFDAERRRRLNFIARTYLEHEWAGPRAEVSLLEFDKTLGFAGHDRVFPEGYSQITDRLAEGTHILLDHEVKQIDYSGARVDVLTNHGSFQANHVLVTVPLGVLQAGRIAFNPSLPRDKREAIRTTRMGVFNKIFLKFDSVFWGDDYELIGYMGSQDSDWPEIVNFHKIAGLPVLLAFSAGTAGEQNERRSDAELVVCLMDCLRKMYGPNIPQPSGHLITRWNQDPFSLGSYSYTPVGAKQSQRRQIGTPVENRVFFAGEATSQFFPSTVHGAFLSGVRAAYEIVLADAKRDLLKDGQGPVDLYV